MLSRKPNILVAAGNSECGCLVKHLKALGNVTETWTVAETLQHFKSREFDVLFCAWEIQDGTWSDLMEVLQNEKLQLPTIVYYHCGGEAEWTEALDHGAFDLIVPPFDPYKLTVLLEHAMASREHVQQVAHGRI